MKKKLMDGFSKIKEKIENINIATDDQKKKELKKGIQFLMKEFTSKTTILPDLKEFDYYYTTNESNDHPILFIAVIAFHHKKGSIVEFTYPVQEEILKAQSEFFSMLGSGMNISNENILDDIFNQLTYLCLPDAVHTTNEDAQFFLIQNYSTLLYGISCYRQLATKSIEVDEENTRECVQKAMCIVSKLPMFGQLYSKLSSTMTAFFNQSTLKDKSIIEQLFHNYDSLSFKNININELFMSFSLRKLIMFSKDKIFALIKLLMLEKNIIVYSHVSNNVCSFILSLISLFPGNSLFNLNYGSSVKNYLKCIAMYGLPLKFLNRNSKIFPLFTLFDFEKIENCYSYVIGTTNQLVLKHNKLRYDCIVNIDTQKIIITNDIPERVLKITKSEKNIYADIHNKFKDNFKYDTENWMVNMNLFQPEFIGSDDYIRNEFKNYFFSFFINMSLAQRIANEETCEQMIDGECISDDDDTDKEKDKSQEKDKDDNKVSSKELKELQKKQNKIKKEQEKSIQKSIKKVLHGFNCDFICYWTQTYNFKIWNDTHDKQLSLRSQFLNNESNVTIAYENGDFYSGFITRGKKHGMGIYSEFSTGGVYNGTWDNDMKSGVGCLTSNDNKYIYDGEWRENKKWGQGQLINNRYKYSGTFVNDVYHGSGILCDMDGNIYEGDFLNGLFDGMGHFKAGNGDNYIGQFALNQFCGKGQLSYADGSIYNGEFKDGKRHGEGLLLLSNGDKYEGMFKDNQFDGEGVYITSSGIITKGYWIRGIMNNNK